MRTTAETMGAIWRAECMMREEGMKPYMGTLFAYFASVEGTPTSLNAAQKAMAFSSDKTLAKSFRVLKELTAIKQRPAKNGQYYVDIKEVDNEHELLTDSSIRTLHLLLLSINTTDSKGKNREDDTEAEAGQFSESDVKMDSDWRTAEPILLKYFKPHQISPVKLSMKKRFEKLCELLTDETFDFDAYCKWYRIEKYPKYKFNYGLFLYPDMIAEFRDSLEDDDTYLKTTTNLANSESHKQGVKRTKEFIDSLEDE